MNRTTRATTTLNKTTVIIVVHNGQNKENNQQDNKNNKNNKQQVNESNENNENNQSTRQRMKVSNDEGICVRASNTSGNLVRVNL